jgi:transposase
MAGQVTAHLRAVDGERPIGLTDACVQTPAAPHPPKPWDLEFVTITRREHIELRQRASQFQSLHSRALERMKWMQLRHDHERHQAQEQLARVQAELALAQAQIRDLRQRVFGAKTEQSRSVNTLAQTAAVETPRRPRGQQRGLPGHGRTRSTLSAVVQEVDNAVCCPQCGLQAVPAWGSESSEVLEIEVKAYRRVLHRPRLRPACRCGCLPGVLTAPLMQTLWPRNKLGVSVWTELLLSKFLYGLPTARLLQDWSERGLHVAQGTVTDGLQRLAPLFLPIMDACLDELRVASHWHADETRWEVFEDLPGKTGHRWYLWVFKAERVVCFVLDPSRSSAVPAKTLAGVTVGILSVDRFAAYRKFARLTKGMTLALCWAHQRRDFLRVANDHPALWAWAMQWVHSVGELYELHRVRRQLFSEGLDPGNAADTPAATAYIEADTRLRAHVEMLQQRCATELADAQLAAPSRKVLCVLQSYWPGLLTFVDHPWLDLDNNAAERALRPAVVGRKNYYGSGSQWSGQLAANLLSIFGTVRLWGVNPRTWLQSYLQACAHEGGRAPADIDAFIPWRMSPQQLAAMRQVSGTASSWAAIHNTS